MGFLRASVSVAMVVGIGLALGWRLNDLKRGPARGGTGLHPRKEEEAQEPSPGEAVAAVEPAQPAGTLKLAAADNLCDLDSQASSYSEGWARRRQEHVQAILGEETYQTLEALIRWWA